jgi:cell division protease FtsH
MNQLRRNLFLFLAGLLVISIIFANVQPQAKPEEIGLRTLVEKIENGEVQKIEIEDNSLKVFGQDDVIFSVRKESGSSLSETLSNFGLSPEQLNSFETLVVQPNQWTRLLQAMLPSLIFLIGFAVVFIIVARQMQGANSKAMSFGQSKAKQVDNKNNRVTFKDVAGAEEAKEELQEVVDFLKHPKKYADIGARIPRGILMVGSPGTGKTLLARAVAGEAGVPFFFMSGSDFMEMFVGVGASRVRDLFNNAKKASPCIIFVDEIDAVGRRRGSGVGGGHDEREQTLNQILVEMDGFDPTVGVIVMAATNRPDILDPALLRPGRFDRRVTLDLPTREDREKILEVHAKNKPLAENVNLRRIAERTIGFSGADLMNIMNEGAILAARKNNKKISQQHLLEAIEKVMIGPARKKSHNTDEERKLTAYHEVGHAIVGHLLPYGDDIHKVSIISRGMAGGYTMSLPEDDRRMKFRREYLDQISMILGGYAAESVIYGDITPGASNDLQKATGMAKRMVTRFGMSEVLGPRTYGEAEDMIFLGKEIHENRDYSEKTAEQIDGAVLELLNNALKIAKEIIKNNRKKMDEIVEVLLKKETIEKEEWEKIVGVPKKMPKFQPL